MLAFLEADVIKLEGRRYRTPRHYRARGQHIRCNLAAVQCPIEVIEASSKRLGDRFASSTPSSASSIPRAS
jgi:hypothetical protein